MKVTELFERVCSEWPPEVDISDGRPCGKSGYLFPTLSRYWDNVELRWENENDDLMGVAIWAFFQTAHKAAKEAVQDGNSQLIFSDLSVDVFEKYLRDNLANDCWDEIRNLVE
jgi:hypothetical protein